MIIEQVIARISADTTGIKRGVQESNNLLRSLGQSANQASRTSSQGFMDMARGIKGVEQATRSAKSTMFGFIAATGAINMMTTAWNAAKSAVIDFNSTLEQATIGFTTMLGSASKANVFIKELKDFAVKTPFEFSTLITASQRLMALGFSAEKVQPMLASVGDAVAALGGSMQDSGQRIIRALGQMQAKGKVSAEEMMQLSEAGISAWQYLADAYGVTTAEIMETSRKTAVDSGTAITAIMEGMTNDFGGMMMAQSKTLQGAMSNIVDYMEQTAGAMTMPIYEAMRDGVLKLSQIFGSREFEQQSMMIAESLSQGMEAGFKQAGALFDSMQPYIKSFFQSFSDNKATFKDIGDSLLQLAEAAGKFASSAIEVGAALIAATPPVTITALNIIAESLARIGEFATKYEGPIKALLLLFAARKMLSFAHSILSSAAAFKVQAAASLQAATSLNMQAVAQDRLTAATARGAATSSIGVIPGLAKVQAGNMNLVTRNAGMATKATYGLKSGMGALAAAFNPATLAMGAAAVAMMAWSANTAQQTKFLDDFVAGVIEAGETIPEKMALIGEAMDGALPDNRDIAYSGGLLEDFGASLKNIWSGFQSGGAGGAYGALFGRGAGDTSNSLQALIDEQLSLFDQFNNDQEALLDDNHEQFNKWRLGVAEEMANAIDGVDDDMRKLYEAEVEGYAALLDPLNNFKDQTFVTLDEMMTNMTDNLSGLQNFKSNLSYLLSIGEDDAAAYFANIGPAANLAMSELIHGTPEDMAKFNQLVSDGFATAGIDATDAMWSGLEAMPGLATAAGYDIASRLTAAAVEEARLAQQKLPNAYNVALDEIKKNAETTMGLAFGGAAMIPAVQESIDELTTAFNGLDPEKLIESGITPEMLGIPEVQVALAELALEGGAEDPIQIMMTVGNALEEIGLLQSEVDTLFTDLGAPPDLIIKSNSLDTMGDINGVKAAVKALDNMADVHIKVYLDAILTGTDLAKSYVQPYTPRPNNSWYSGNGPAGANGLITFANGGMLPKQAKIQSPGTLVQWAEPETGGEAFIPLGRNKRDQALDVWREVGRRFGMIAFNNGGITKPDLFVPNSKKKSSSGSSSTKSSSGGGGIGFSAPTTWGFQNFDQELSGWQNFVKIILDDQNRMYENGDMTADAYLASLNNSLGAYTKYSDEWISITNQIAAVEADLDAQRQEALDHQRMIQDNMYGVGDIGEDQYLAILRDRINMLDVYSDEWMSVWQQIQSIGEQQEAEQIRLTAAMFEVGIISEQDYLNSLKSRLVQTQQFSVEWMDLWREITAIEQAALDEQVAAIEQAYNDIADPLSRQTDMVAQIGSGRATGSSLTRYYERMASELGRWTDGIEQLAKMGLNQDFLRRLISNGPDSLPFVESLIQGGAGMVSIINTGEKGLASKIDAFATSVSGYATGISSAPGGLAVLGEDGPELVSLPAGSRVTPRSQTYGEVGSSMNAAEIQTAVEKGMIRGWKSIRRSERQ